MHYQFDDEPSIHPVEAAAVDRKGRPLHQLSGKAAAVELKLDRYIILGGRSRRSS